MKKRSLAGLGLALALSLSGLAPQAAFAYPPGTALQVAPGSSVVKFGSATYITATNTTAGRSTFYINGVRAASRTSKVSGATLSWLFKPARPGVYTVSATSGSESNSTVVYVPQKPTLPRSITVRKSFPVNLKYVAPGTLVSVSVNGAVVATDVAGADGLITITVAANKLSRGSNAVLVNYGGSIITGGKVSGLK